VPAENFTALAILKSNAALAKDRKDGETGETAAQLIHLSLTGQPSVRLRGRDGLEIVLSLLIDRVNPYLMPSPNRLSMPRSLLPASSASDCPLFLRADKQPVSAPANPS
jgi:hypothetical protein